MKTVLLQAAAAVFCCLPSSTRAAPLSLDQVVEQAFVHSPEAAKLDADLARSVAEAFSTRVKENPVLSAGVELPLDPPSHGREDVEVSVSVSQSIRASDFGAREGLARAMESAGNAEKVLAVIEFVQNLNLVYVRAWQYQAAEKALAEARTRAKEVLDRVTGGANEGLFSVGDLELFTAELKSFEAESVAAKSELARSQAELSRLSGVPVNGRELALPPEELTVSKPALLQLVKESKLPVQKRYAALLRLAERQVEVARLDRRPAIAPALGYARHDDGTSQITVGVSVPLPFFNRNQAEEARARGALAAAERGSAYATSDVIATEAGFLYDALQSTAQQIKIYREGVVPSRRRAVTAYYRQLDSGVGTVFQLWQSQRELNQSNLHLLELRVLLATVRGQLNALIGQPQFH